MPCGWGGNIRGGGTAGPSGEVESERAGDPGEYHHSRNLTKNIADGRSSLRESKNNCGEVMNSRRIQARTPRRRSGEALLSAAALMAR